MCVITGGRDTNACEVDGVGGIKMLYIGNYTQNLHYYVTESSNSISGVEATAPDFINEDGNVINGTSVYSYAVQDGGIMEENQVSDPNNKSRFFETSGNFQMRVVAADMNLIDDLSKTKVYIIAELNDGTRRIYGLTEGLFISMSHTTGAEMTDYNGVTINISGRDLKMSQSFSATLTESDYLTFDWS